MSKDQKTPKKLTSPQGTAVFPWLHKPDTKFHPEGMYSLKLRLSEKDADDLIKAIDEAMEDSAIQAQKEDQKRTVKKASPPYVRETDVGVSFTFRMKAKVTTKTGEQFEQKPTLFDAEGKKVSVQVGSGSIVRVSFLIVPFYTPLIGAGVTLRLTAVQIIKLVQGDGRSASDFGFGKEEGYIYIDESDSADDRPNF